MWQATMKRHIKIFKLITISASAKMLQWQVCEQIANVRYESRINAGQLLTYTRDLHMSENMNHADPNRSVKGMRERTINRNRVMLRRDCRNDEFLQMAK